MSRSMRAVRSEWADAASVFVDVETFGKLMGMLLGEETAYTYVESEADEVFKLFVGCGQTFLDRVKQCDPQKVTRKLDKSLRQDAASCLANLKALEPAWREFMDKDGHLEVWVDAF